MSTVYRGNNTVRAQRCDNTQVNVSCTQRLQELYDAYISLISGTNVVETQGTDFRRVQFGQGDLSRLQKMYEQLYKVCGAQSGLPAQLGTSRGGPAYLRP